MKMKASDAVLASVDIVCHALSTQYFVIEGYSVLRRWIRRNSLARGVSLSDPHAGQKSAREVYH